MDGDAQVYTDLRLAADGCARVVLVADGMSPRRLGRAVQRLLEVETYRMMALLGLPMAREVGASLMHAERDLADVAGQIRSARRHEEPELLRQLTQLAGQVESLYARTHARFSASGAMRLAATPSGSINPVPHSGPTFIIAQTVLSSILEKVGVTA